MATVFHVSILLCALIAGSAAQVVINDVRLTKYTREHSAMNLGDEDLSYTLECVYDAPRDSINYIAWQLEGYDHWVYVWDASTDAVTVEDPLLNHVEGDTESTKIGPNIHFKHPTTLMRGIYTCFIFHHIEEETVNPVLYRFDLQMYYFDTTSFEMTASLDGCNILLNYSSNILYPKPNATCGFWDTRADQSIGTINGGLTFHQRIDSKWQVATRNSPIEVKEIPRDSLLYCDVSLPIANFTHHKVLENNADTRDVYNAIDERGCNIALLKESSDDMDISFMDCDLNCRDECQKSSKYLSMVQFECKGKLYAYWPSNRSRAHLWYHEASCDPLDHIWYSGKNKPLDLTELPVCLNRGSGMMRYSMLSVAAYIIFINKLLL